MEVPRNTITKKFYELSIGDKFKCLNIPYTKIDYNESGVIVTKQKPNAMNLCNHRKITFSPDVEVEVTL